MFKLREGKIYFAVASKVSYFTVRNRRVKL